MIEWIVMIGAAALLLFSGVLLGYSMGRVSGREEGFRKGHAAASKWSGRKV